MLKYHVRPAVGAMSGDGLPKPRSRAEHNALRHTEVDVTPDIEVKIVNTCSRISCLDGNVHLMQR